MIARHQSGNLATLDDHDFCMKGKSRCQFSAELRLGHRLADHEGAGGADADRIQVLQLPGKHCRPEGPVAADVDSPQKDH
jgi:hypothetical protein